MPSSALAVPRVRPELVSAAPAWAGPSMRPLLAFRVVLLAFIGERLHAAVLTPREGKVHVISLRKANSREVKRYAKTPKSRTD